MLNYFFIWAFEQRSEKNSLLEFNFSDLPFDIPTASINLLIVVKPKSCSSNNENMFFGSIGCRGLLRKSAQAPLCRAASNCRNPISAVTVVSHADARASQCWINTAVFWHQCLENHRELFIIRHTS